MYGKPKMVGDKKKKLEAKIEKTQKEAFVRSKSESEQYEESRKERRAQKKLKRLNKRLDRIN